MEVLVLLEINLQVLGYLAVLVQQVKVTMVEMELNVDMLGVAVVLVDLVLMLTQVQMILVMAELVQLVQFQALQ